MVSPVILFKNSSINMRSTDKLMQLSEQFSYLLEVSSCFTAFVCLAPIIKKNRSHLHKHTSLQDGFLLKLQTTFSSFPTHYFPILCVKQTKWAGNPVCFSQLFPTLSWLKCNSFGIEFSHVPQWHGAPENLRYGYFYRQTLSISQMFARR